MGLAAFLSRAIKFISSSFKLLLDWYSLKRTVVKSVDVERIRQDRRIFPPDTESRMQDSNPDPVMIEEWEQLDAIAASYL